MLAKQQQIYQQTFTGYSHYAKICAPNRKYDFPLFECIADGEHCIQTIQDKEEQEIARNQFSTIIDKYTYTTKSTCKDKFILNTADKTRKFLKKNNNIIVVTSDKGNVTVAMDKQDYTQKINSILKERSTYKVLKRDPTTTLQQKNNDLVENLFEEKVITLKEKYSLTQRVATAPRIYGLSKIHKDNMPLCRRLDALGIFAVGYLANFDSILLQRTQQKIIRSF